MRRKKEQPYYVIAASPLDQTGYGGQGSYYDHEGRICHDKCRAAIFSAFDEAEEFATARGIKLENAVPYIAKVWFQEFEINRLWRYRESKSESEK